jgi:Tfp pilus assembly protein PilW
MMNRSVMQRQMFAQGGEAERVSPPSYMSDPRQPRSVVEKFPDIYVGPDAIPLREMPSDALMQIVASDGSSSDEIMEAAIELQRRGFDSLKDIPMVRGRNSGAPGGPEGHPQRSVYARDPESPIFNRGYIQQLEQQRAGTRNVAASEDMPFEDRYFLPMEEFRYGGDVKKMQMGGEPMAAPSAAPADMSGIAGMLSQTEQSTAQGTQQLGAEYAQNMMVGIEGAEDFKTMIDSIRGNDVPMQARYEELASYVGPQDAQQTPESVLAMVQPTIMMTEEGAMSSGIGDLMQGIAGSVEMETAGGQPTAMGQGVGSMLMAGAQEPVQAFRNGGIVKKYNVGGVASANDPALHEAFYAANVLKPGYGGQTPIPGTVPQKSGINFTVPQTPSLESLYEKSLPLYQKIMSQSGSDKNLSKSQILFDVARRALAFAGGVSPDTGENIANKSMAAQAAIATQTLPTTMSAEIEKIRKAEQGAKLGALESASSQYSTLVDAANKAKLKQEEYEAKGAIEQMKIDAKAMEPVKFGPEDTVMINGEIVTSGKGSKDFKSVRVRFADGTLSEESFNQENRNDQQRLTALLNSSPGSFIVDKDPNVSTPDFLLKRSNIFNNSATREKIKTNTATEQEIRAFSQAIVEYTQPSEIEKVTNEGVMKIKRPGNPLDPGTSSFVQQYMPDLFVTINRQTGGYTEPRLVKFGAGRTPEFIGEGMNAEKAREVDKFAFELGIDVFDPSTGVLPLEEEQIFPDIDYTEAFGLPGFVNKVGNKLVDLVSDGYYDEKAMKARSYLQKFNLGLTIMASETYPGSRPPVFFLEQFENLKIKPDAIFFGDVEAYQNINTLIDFIKSDLVTMRQSAFGPTDDKTKKQARQGLKIARETLAQAIVIRNGMEQSLGLEPTNPGMGGTGGDPASLDEFLNNP